MGQYSVQLLGYFWMQFNNIMLALRIDGTEIDMCAFAFID
jgi:hypothetical protein